MSVAAFDSLDGALQDAVMESAYLTQVHVQAANEAALVKTVGFSDPQLPGTIFAETTCATSSCPTIRSSWPRKCVRPSISHSFGKNGGSV